MTRLRARRRSKPSLLRRVRALWVFIVVLLAAAAYGGYLLATWSIFVPKAVGVEGNAHVSAPEIRARAAIPLDRNVWLIDKRSAERRVETIPWIQTAAIHRSLPAEIRIVVRERVPVACVESATNRYLVDDSGHVIETRCSSPQMLAISWPPVRKQQAGSVLDAALLRRMLSDAAVLRSAALDVAKIGSDRFGGLICELRDGLVLQFGDDRDLAQKASLVEPILHAYRGRREQPASIDLRAPGTPVVQLRRPKK